MNKNVIIKHALDGTLPNITCTRERIHCLILHALEDRVPNKICTRRYIT